MLTTVKAPRQFEPLFRAAEKSVARYFRSRSHDPGKGTLDISGDRYLLIRTAALSIEFFDTVKDLYKNQGEQQAENIARQLLFDIAHALGRQDARHFHQRLKLTTPIARLSAGPVFFAHAGWAQVKIFPESRPVPNENYYLLYDHPYSFEADAWLRSGRTSSCPVCIMNAGYSSGWCRESFGQSLVASEIMCRAAGDRACRFIMAPPDRIQAHIGRYFKSRKAQPRRQTPYPVPEFFQRNHMEQALTASEDRYRRLFDASTDGILLLDAHTLEVLGANARVMTLLGMPRETVLHRHIKDIVVRRGSSAFLAALGKARKSDPVPTQDMPLQLVNGRRLIVNVAASVVSLDHTSVLQCMIRDLTERKHAEEQLFLAAKIFECSGEGIIVTDASNRIALVNQAFSKHTGYSQEELIGQNPKFFASGRHDLRFYRRMWNTLQRTGQWQGEILNRRKSGEVFPEWLSISAVTDEHHRVQHHIGIYTDLTQRKATEKKLLQLAEHDTLTGLPNRLLLIDRLQQAIAEARRRDALVIVLFLDLDEFKGINDGLGHAAGDELLRLVAGRLKAALRAEDTVARLGGDEFVVVLPEFSQMDAAVHTAEKVREHLQQPYLLDGRNFNVTSSIGISVYPHDGKTVESLLRNADKAMYRAKNRGRNRYEFFNREIVASALARFGMEMELRRALEKDELFMVYQPQIDLATGGIVGVEALLRWRHRKKGVLLPETFLPIADESDLIVDIGQWVLRTACSQNRRWQQAGLPPIPMAVNISHAEFRQKNLPTTVGRVLREAGLAPQWLALEIPENVITGNSDANLDMIRKLVRKGVRLVMDGFGSGNSSLRFLTSLPITKIKIDKKFVQNASRRRDDAAVVRAVIGMAHNLGIRTLAQGPERAEHIHFLRACLCKEAQGSYYYSPLPPGTIARLLAKGSTGHAVARGKELEAAC